MGFADAARAVPSLGEGQYARMDNCRSTPPAACSPKRTCMASTSYWKEFASFAVNLPLKSRMRGCALSRAGLESPLLAVRSWGQADGIFSRRDAGAGAQHGRCAVLEPLRRTAIMFSGVRS